jgi:plasmid stabilization system protein ParE
MKIDFRRIARREYDEAVSWYENKEPGLGREFQNELDLLLKRIASHPEQFRQIRGILRRGVLRRFPYVVYFLTEPERVVVLAVFHAKRDPVHLENRSRS